MNRGLLSLLPVALVCALLALVFDGTPQNAAKAASAAVTAQPQAMAAPAPTPTRTSAPKTAAGPLFFTSPLKPPYALTNTSHSAAISPAADYAPRPNLGNDKHLVYAPIDGKVTLRSRWQTANGMGVGNYGNSVVVTGERYKVLVAHCSDKAWALARDGAQVMAGTPLCWMGSTGWTSPPGAAHVHLEVWRDGKRVDPRGVMGVPDATIYNAPKTAAQADNNFVMLLDERKAKTALPQTPDAAKMGAALLREVPDIAARLAANKRTAMAYEPTLKPWDGTFKVVLMDMVLIGGQRVVAWLADFDRIEIDPVLAANEASVEEVLAHELGHVKDLLRDGGPSGDVEAGAEKYKPLFRGLVSEAKAIDPAALIRRYFPQAQWANAERVMKCESGGVASKVGDDYPINGLHVPSYGLFQIRAFASRAKAEGLTDQAFRAKLREAEYNVQYAAKLWRQVGQKWSPTWSCAMKLGIK